MRKLMYTALGFAAGTAVLVYGFGGVSLLAAGGAGLLFFLCLPFKKPLLRRMMLVFLGFSLGALWCSGVTLYRTAQGKPLCTGQTVTFSGVAETFFRANTYSGSVELRLDGSGLRALLYCGEEGQAVRPGDRVAGEAVFSPTPTEYVAGNDLYLRASGIFLTASAEDTVTVLPVESPDLRYGLVRFSRRLQNSLYALLPQETAGYAAALVTGDREGLDYAFGNLLSLCGLYHAVSLSGMHVSVIMGAVLVLCGRRRRLAALLGVPLLVLFVLTTGAAPATVRSAVMQSVLLLAFCSRREYDPPTALSFALLLLLIADPWSFGQWGLQLSFLSTCGILLLTPPLLRHLRRRTPRGRVWTVLLEPVWAGLAVTLSATAVSMPLTAVYFGLGSLIAPLANLLALWAVMASFLLSMVTALLGLVLPGIAALPAAGISLLYSYLEGVVTLCSSVPFAAVSLHRPLLLAWCCLWYVLLLFWVLLRRRRYLPPLCAAVTLACALVLSRPLQNGASLLDVGQGQCGVLTRDGTTVMVDCGGTGGEKAGETAARFLEARGIREVDAFILTHFDRDHIGGAEQLLRRIRVRRLYYPANGDPDASERELLARFQTMGTVLCPVTETTVLETPGMTLTVLDAQFEKENNECGLCVLASGGKCDMLFTGDLSMQSENRLLAENRLPDLEVLVAGHHGAANSTGALLLQLLSPETVLISAGENPYGHPARQTLQRIRAAGAAAYCTRENGTITVRW